jgi:tetratricopeptide (TPR) repeat protein
LLLRARRYPEAESLLGDRLAGALAHGDTALAAHCAGLRATLFSVQRRDAEALQALEEVERFDPRDGTRFLNTASHLLYAMEDPGRALEKVESALRLIAGSPQHSYSLPDALGLEAVAWLRLGRDKEAMERFDAFRRAAESGPMKPEIDLRLVEELILSGRRAADCDAYLEHVLSWAERTRNTDLRARATHLRSRLRGSTPSSP